MQLIERESSPIAALSGARGPRWGVAAAGLVGAIVIVAAAFVAWAHVDDRYRVDTASGARIALARYAGAGNLYPDLYDGRVYGGTRFMPVPLLLHAGVAEITGEYLASGKVVTYAGMIALLVTLFVLIRRTGCPRLLALGLAASVIAAKAGLSSATSIRGDPLPAFLQLAAVGLIASRGSRRTDVAAAGIAALALAAKLSALWAPIGITVYLVAIDRRRALRFVLWYGAIVAGLLALFGIITGGRLFENVFGLSTAGVGGLRSVVVAPYRLLTLIFEQALPGAILAPFAVLSLWLAVAARRPSVYSASAAAGVLVVVVMLTDLGTGWNQLLDLAVLVALVVGAFAGRLWAQGGSRSATATVVVAAVVWANMLGLAAVVWPEARAAVQAVSDPNAWTPRPLEGYADRSTSVLAEDPYAPVSLGQDPIVLDPFMVPRIGERDPEAVAALVERIDAREFDLLVLVTPLEPANQEWWRDYHFGLEVTAAMERSYVFETKTRGYNLYVPSDGGAP